MCASSSGYPDTSLLGGARVSKADARIEACGAVDELNCQVGVAAVAAGRGAAAR